MRRTCTVRRTISIRSSDVCGLVWKMFTTIAATFSAPTTGLRAAVALPPLSAVQAASGARRASSPCMSPVVAAVMNCSAIRAISTVSAGSKAEARPH